MALGPEKLPVPQVSPRFCRFEPRNPVPTPIAFPGPHTPLVAGPTTQQHQGNLLEVRALPWP